MEVESGQEGADARAWGKDATHEATPHACPAAAAPVPPEGSVAAILEAVRVLGERADAEDPQEAAGDGQVVTAKRASLDPETVTLLVFLHEAIPGGIEREACAVIDVSIILDDE